MNIAAVSWRFVFPAVRFAAAVRFAFSAVRFAAAVRFVFPAVRFTAAVRFAFSAEAFYRGALYGAGMPPIKTVNPPVGGRRGGSLFYYK